jgi:hypothetical protein
MDQGERKITEHDSQGRTEQIPAASILRTEHSETAEASPSRQNKPQQKEDQSWPHKTEALCAVALVFITGFYTYYARKQAGAAIEAANASKQASDTAAQALRDSEDSFSKTLAQMQSQTDAQKETADAAKQAAEGSSKSFKLQMRAWIAVHPIQIQTGSNVTTYVIATRGGLASPQNPHDDVILESHVWQVCFCF